MNDSKIKRKKGKIDEEKSRKGKRAGKERVKEIEEGVLTSFKMDDKLIC